MTANATFGRAAWLALGLWVCGVCVAFAHALPGSVLIFSQQGDRLALRISLPLEDLLIAAPELAAVTYQSQAPSLSQADATAVAAYFARHISIQQPSARFDLTLSATSLQTAYNAHVGDYDLLTLQFNVERSGTGSGLGPFFPMTLRYDAVMHEVRNHRAKVYWQDDSPALFGLAEFGFKAVEGTQSPVLLTRP